MSQDIDPQDIPTIPIPTLAVVSCHSGVLCTDIGDVYRLLGHVLGDDQLMTHQLPAASRTANQWLEDQYPWLLTFSPRIIATATADDAKQLPLLNLLREVLTDHGEELDVPRWPSAPWLPGQQLKDLVDVVGRENIAYLGIDPDNPDNPDTEGH